VLRDKKVVFVRFLAIQVNGLYLLVDEKNSTSVFFIDQMEHVV
jgi:hypothetical protein